MDNIVETLKLKGDRILVRLVKSDEKIGSIYIPETARARRDKRRKDAWKAVVVSLGDMVDNEILRHVLKKDDVVYCDPVALDCPNFTEKDERYIIITDEDVVALEAN